MSVQMAGVLTILVFYLLFFIVGAGAGRRKGSDQSTSGLLLANRGIPLPLAVLTLTATWVGGGYINGTAEAVFDPNRGLVWAQAPWGYALSLALGGLLFARRMRRHDFTTLLDPFQKRYGNRVAAGLFLAALTGEIFWSAAILAALGTTLGTILDLDYSVAILLSAVVAVAYTTLGGLWSVAYTDALQLLCILGGLSAALPFALDSVGGLSAALGRYGDLFGTSAQLVPPLEAWKGDTAWGYSGWAWSDTALLLILGGIPWQVYFQRVLACRDPRSAVRLSMLAGLGCLIMAVPAVMIGVVGATIDWSHTAAGVPPRAALVLPYVLRYLTPPLIAAVGLGAVAAAVMSSVDSSILSISSMFAWNVYRPLLRESATDLEMRRVTRATIVVAGLSAAALALAVKSVYTLWYLCSDLVFVILLPQLTMALYSRHANRIGAVTGAIVGLGLRLGGGEPYLGIPALIPYPMTAEDGTTAFPFRTVAMLASLASIWMVSRLTGSWSPPRQLDS